MIDDAMDAVEAMAEWGSPRRGRRMLGIAALAAAALVVAVAGVVVLALRAARVREAVRAIETAGGVVAWDYELAALFDDATPPEERERAWRAAAERRHDEYVDPDGRAWLRRLLGPEWLHHVAAVDLITSYDAKGKPTGGASLSAGFAAYIPAFPRLKRLILLEATDRTLHAIGALRDLEDLAMWDAKVTDGGLCTRRGSREPQVPLGGHPRWPHHR